MKGAALFGKTDEVPGVMYVATRFLHAYYIPLLPRSSWIVYGTPKGKWLASEWQGHQLAKLYWPSVLVAWLRVALLGSAALLTLVGLTSLLLDARPTDSAALLVAAVSALLGVWLSYRLSAPRADRLARLLDSAEPPAELKRRALNALRANY